MNFILREKSQSILTCWCLDPQLPSRPAKEVLTLGSPSPSLRGHCHLCLAVGLFSLPVVGCSGFLSLPSGLFLVIFEGAYYPWFLKKVIFFSFKFWESVPWEFQRHCSIFFYPPKFPLKNLFHSKFFSPILILTVYVTICFLSGSFSLTLTFCKFTTVWLGHLLNPFKSGKFSWTDWLMTSSLCFCLFLLKLLLVRCQPLGLMSTFCIFNVLLPILAVFFFLK